ncbi:MAG: UDP-N-acetylmuramoyl-tripeptide--D-alanyl-D-alanine ligase, partial [Clostridium sp.]|nr:UDP-N-acetylmuramoyl-tripeptide--D-alanyl-D-alanine ligase [Clostridium sp.]
AFAGCYCFSSYLTLAANWILKPVQGMINRRYYNDAARILRSMPSLTVIGVTGSYGKTSTKHYLHRILSEKFETVMTPGSFNTTLGVVRTVRECLHPYTEVFIAEMGAKQRGDIREICDLVHPTIGIVTAVGPQHLESFKTIENVQATKFELIDALPSDGFAVINNDFEMIANRPVDSPAAVVRYGIRNRKQSAAVATDIVSSASGTDFTLTYDGVSHRFHTRLVGECNVSNLLAAIVTAIHLGVEPNLIARAVERIEQVEHRLNIKRTAGGVVIIDDAFNSNPAGSAMALDLLAGMTGGKRIVITPGMIELGEQQEELNREFGRRIAASADVAIVVGEYNRRAITEGIAEGANPSLSLYEAADFADAQRHLQEIARPGDTVLYENDLPDTFK